MKIILLLTLFFYYKNVLGQKLSEKEIVSLKTLTSQLDSWNMGYDPLSGSWLYAHYDTTSKRYFLYDKSGSSGPFNYVVVYNCIFDEYGNYYVIADNSDYEIGKNEYLIIKNGSGIMRYEYINDQWVYKNGIIYFYYKENAKYYLAKYHTNSERLEKGKPYDEISYIYYPQKVYEGEPVGELTFTSDGKEIYGASDKGKKFIVIGSEEGKKYSDIDFYSIVFDNNGNLCFIAKSKGTLWSSRGDCFIVQGDKEYKKFDYIYGPIIISSDNVPVYVGQDSIGEYKYRSYLMKGNDEIDKLIGSIFYYRFSPDSSLTYVRSKEIKKGDEIIYESQLVYGSWKSKTYNSIYNTNFAPNGDIYYVASGNDNKTYCLRKDERISESYDNVFGITWLEDHRFAYIGAKYGNYEQKIPDENYYFIGNDRYGPYEVPLIVDYTSGSYFLSDTYGNFAFHTGRNVDKDNYFYKYRVNSNKFISDEFDGISYIKLINGKIVFIANNQISRDPYYYKFRVYIDNKPVGDEYDSIGKIDVNRRGNIEFMAVKGNTFYLVELEL